ncbi:MAG: Asp-tRNA(Asn)/Glu-tRNA(Gln) amidotransferase subunit GatC, partial [Deltaproteobacteria bacterium]|nr:Asp-tRNA(Asn)/Glu-tRNA(Gln) amidotransferase subunit GatC [Deltaproteobacteria bacterium]
LDLEASFIDEEFIYELIEELIVRMFAVGHIPLTRPLQHMTYQGAMERYGTDRPDLRFDMAFEDVTDSMKETDYAVFKGIARHGGHIKGFCVRGQADKLSKNLLQNEYAMRIVPSLGGKGMTWMKVVDGALQSNIVQFFSPSELDRLQERFGARDGDVLMMVADKPRDVVNQVLCSLRLHVAKRLNLAADELYRPLWVTHFPLFESKEEGVSSLHHPFTMPDRIDFDPTDTEELLALNSRAYDLVMNGEELGGGSIRIHDAAVQRKVFRALGLSPAEAEAKFGFFLKALAYGPPPHAGLALGLDRVVAMILKTDSIRDVIAFPKNRRAFCPLTRAPADVDPDQLKELGLTGTGPGTLRAEAPGADRRGGPAGSAPAPEKITLKEVRHVAKLARLKLDEAEIEGFQEDLNAILDSMETLKTLDTETTQPMKHVLDLKNVWRDDEPRKGKDSESILENAPQREGDFFRVTKILEG